MNPTKLSIDQKRGLLADLRQRKAQQPEKYPLAFTQEEVWLLQWLLKEPSLFIIPVVFRLTGLVNTDALVGALRETVRRQGALRTHFEAWDWEIVQSVDPALKLEVEIVDLCMQDKAVRDAEARRIATQTAAAPFDLAKAPLARFKLIRISEFEYFLVTVFHRIVVDGWSLGVFFYELGHHYAAFSTGKAAPLPELAIQYGDYTLWLRRRMQAEVLQEHLAYWKNQLHAAPMALELPRDLPGAEPSFCGARLHFKLAADDVSAFQKICQMEGATLYMGLLAAFVALLHCWTGSPDIVLAAVASTNRDRKETEGLIGLFGNLLLVRSRTGRASTFRNLLRQVRAYMLGAYAHQDVPLLQLFMELGSGLSAGNMPYRTLFSFQRTSSPSFTMLGLNLELVKLDVNVTSCELGMFIHPDWGGPDLMVAFEYMTHLFAEETIKRLIRRYRNIIETASGYPDIRLDMAAVDPGEDPE